MSIIQSNQKNLRFLKRKNLDEEARIIGTWYSDLIQQYGLDCIYYKLDTKVFGNYKGIVDSNTILYQAYGYNINPDYSCSAYMITYPEIQTDIFQLNKYGEVPQSEIDFHFDAKQFACDLAIQCGQLKEYKIKESEIICQIPNFNNETSTIINPETQEISTIYLSSVYFPYALGLGYKENFECEILSGRLSVQIDGYEYGKEYTIMCDPYYNTKPHISFNKNKDLYKSLEYEINGEDDFETMIFLKFKVDKILVGNNPKTGYDEYRSILSGQIFGGVLFYDINSLGKYIELIHPEVGDIVEIDFPDENNREKYEITDCYDKSLQSDGISPLLHKYIWKCKARRYVNSYDSEVIEINEADEKLEEKIKYDQVVSEQVSKTISKYDDGDQEAYGGYDGVIENYDKQNPIKINKKAIKYENLNREYWLDIIRFEVGSRLVTDGYDLIFVNVDNEAYIVAKDENTHEEDETKFECGLKWLKATKDHILFINIEGSSTKLAEDESITKNELQICLDDLHEKTLDSAIINKNNQNFIKFKECKSIIFATQNNLFAKLESNQKIYRLV